MFKTRNSHPDSPFINRSSISTTYYLPTATY
ncbi:MAG: hypothetical protein ACI9ZT_002232 [Gammaproteobacteria bacterium]